MTQGSNTPRSKRVLAARIAAETGLGSKRMKMVVNRVFAYIRAEMLAGRDVEIRGFGTFCLRPHAAMRTGIAGLVPAHMRPFFKPHRALKVDAGKVVYAADVPGPAPACTPPRRAPQPLDPAHVEAFAAQSNDNQ